VLRARVTVAEGAQFDPAEFARTLAPYADRVLPIEVIPERKQAARVETAKPVSEMPAADALCVWLQHRETAAAMSARVEAAFGTLTEATA
jgi:hypothetical protein